jgi:hypothetical protein
MLPKPYFAQKIYVKISNELQWKKSLSFYALCCLPAYYPPMIILI